MTTPSFIVKCLKSDFNTAQGRIKYAEDIAAMRGEDAHLYAEAARLLKEEAATESGEKLKLTPIGHQVEPAEIVQWVRKAAGR